MSIIKLLNFGSLNIDIVYRVENFVRPGETVASSSRQIFCGGKGLNQSIALARAGAEVYHAGAVGEDDGLFLIDILKKNNVNVDLVKMSDTPTGHAIIQVDSDGQNCILLYGGANQTISKNHIDEVFSHFEKGDFVVLQNEINNMKYVMEKAHEKGMVIILNPSPMNEEVLSLPLEYVDYLLVNEVEASDISGEQDTDKLLDAMGRKFPDTKIVLTLGALGVKYKYKEETVSHGIFKVDVVDTTGAGDTFTGYFIAGIMNGTPVAEVLETASLAASIAVSRSGAEAAIPFLEEVMRRKSELE